MNPWQKSCLQNLWQDSDTRIPGHSRLEAMRKWSCSKIGANMNSLGPEPYYGVEHLAAKKAYIQKWILNECKTWWNNTPSMRRHAKRFREDPQDLQRNY